MVVEPCTVAWNGNVPPVAEEAVVGDTRTAVTPLLVLPPSLVVVPLVDAITTVALADFVESAILCAVTRPTPPFIGAVKMPAGVIVPIVVDQVTESLAVAP